MDQAGGRGRHSNSPGHQTSQEDQKSESESPTTSTNPTMDLDVDMVQESPKRRCHRCDDCYLSLPQGQSLQFHKQRFCINRRTTSSAEKSLVDSYETYVAILGTAMRNKKTALDLLAEVTFAMKNALIAHVERPMNIVSVTEYLERFVDARRITDYAILEEQRAFAATVRALAEWSTTLLTRALYRELLNMQSRSQQYNHFLYELMAEAERVEEIVYGMIRASNENRPQNDNPN